MTTTQSTVPSPQQIAHIMESFDFAHVAEVMKKLDWTWWDTAPETPSVERLRETARELLEGLGPESCYCSTGGFVATIDRGNVMALSFSIEEQCGIPY